MSYSFFDKEALLPAVEDPTTKHRPIITRMTALDRSRRLFMHNMVNPMMQMGTKGGLAAFNGHLSW